MANDGLRDGLGEILPGIAERLRNARLWCGLASYAEAARKTGINRHTLKAYESPKRRKNGKEAPTEPSASKLAQLAHTYQVSTDWIVGLSATEGAPPPSAHIIDEINERFTEAIRDAGAMSAIVYVRDPLFQRELRLLVMPGVKTVEPMLGFLFPRSAAERLYEGVGRIDFFDNPTAHEEYTYPLDQLVESNPLFGDFATREQVRSCARLRHFGKRHELEAVAWFNFSDKKADDPDRRHAMARAFETVVQRLPQVQHELASEEVRYASKLFLLLDTTQELTRVAPGFDAHDDRTREQLDHFLRTLLEAALVAGDINKEDGFGVVFRAHEGGRVLRRGVTAGRPWLETRETLDTTRGEGIVSWVALKRRSLLIDNLAKSRFKEIFVDAMHDTVSALAVPVVAGDELLGVIALESRKGKFPPQLVRWLSYAATHAAVAWKLADARQASHKLLTIASTAATTRDVNPLDELAQLIEQAVGASDCNIWLRTEDQSWVPGNEPARHEPRDRPRPRGWTESVFENRRTVWIDRVHTSEPTPYFYENTGWASETDRHVPESPEGGIGDDVVSVLGLPILLRGRCLGVAWARYPSPMSQLPGPQQMEVAQQLAMHAGLVLDLRSRIDPTSPRQDGDEDSHGERERRLSRQENDDAELRERVIPSRAYEFGSVKAYALSEPSGRQLGGDYYAVRKLSQHHLAFLVGDARDEGASEAQRMLPFLAAADLALGEGWSNRAVLGKLHTLGRKWRLRSTAIAFQLEFAEGDGQWVLSVASLGHPRLLILRKALGHLEPSPTLKFASGDHAGDIGFRVPVADDVTPLDFGDTVIAVTDGVTEARRSEDQEPFGPSGIARVVAEASWETPKDLAEAILGAAADHAGELRDDATVLVVGIPERIRFA